MRSWLDKCDAVKCGAWLRCGGVYLYCKAARRRQNRKFPQFPEISGCHETLGPQTGFSKVRTEQTGGGNMAQMGRLIKNSLSRPHATDVEGRPCSFCGRRRAMRVKVWHKETRTLVAELCLDCARDPGNQARIQDIRGNGGKENDRERS